MTGDLIERLEKAERGSYTLDAEMWCARNGYAFVMWDGAGCVYRMQPDSGISHIRHSDIAPVTTSLDAALALAERVLPGWDWKVSGPRPPIEGYDEREGPPHASLTRRGPLVANEGFAVADAATPALALCLAILKARTAASSSSPGTVQGGA